ncbi:NADPH-dependent glutamate synthase [Candidatus Magnetominusculus xianensis]|uniref:Dihydropyrimidine dehydrogenase subunit A n=1 Tax=Candidatus Magnetominusculus xianensis TaxID=1748249 RepID=A0ABR5SHS8_9BACT|nr:NADPH-dependent glutamate synthase [Candidatus Magnetominusculus xianensis]KWT91794.1 dihydropyrimidine dehydrogenase subunit A [Candidatus Magnetominusculus xianensis]MBF0403850.1 NADPH-dependent glutamate synthase [Nitrospirota bacterium]
MPKKVIKRQASAHLPPETRHTNFTEVVCGYTEAEAITEAGRCLQCKEPLCITGCPVRINIKGFINLISISDYKKAYETISEANLFPSICGRVCPQERQCEAACVLGKKQEPVSIGLLERFVGDTARQNDWHDTHEIKPIGKRAAIIGSGPAGLACAYDLVKAGVSVVVFEALHLPGGVLTYGIPEFRLPKEIVFREIDNLTRLGVTIETNMVIGRIHTIEELMGQLSFDVVFIGTGAGYPMGLGVKGESLNGVMSANEFLTRVNLMHGYDFPRYGTPVGIGKNIAVIGCGNTAIDSARTALRLRPDNVYIVYRKRLEESPARKEELHHAMEEGVQFIWLTEVKEIISDNEGWVSGMDCIRGGETGFFLDVDTVIYALGTLANPIIARTTPKLKVDRAGYIETVAETLMTSIPGVFAGGDITKTPGTFTTVIHAMSTGRRAARGMLKYLNVL